MGFYKDWNNCILQHADEADYIRKFLQREKETIDPFYSDDISEFEALYNVLNRDSINYLLIVLVNLCLRDYFSSNEIPCFSTFEVGAVRVPEILEFFPEGISVKSLGYKLMKQTEKWASQKYGENQAKTAAMLHLATIDESKPKLVKITPLGHYLNAYSFEEKKAIIQSLVLQDDYIKYVVQHAINDEYDYSTVSSILSVKTALRRRQNVRRIVKFILEGSAYESSLSSIKWEI